ncbi:MAG TPA: DUF983 domain-containing protein [Gemmatimonadales bacterium]
MRLRCPECRQGTMFGSWFRMRRVCPVCGLEFERASGEVSGGMVVNFVVTGIVIMAGSLYFGLFSHAPLWMVLVGLGLFAIVFPILFYPVSRGLWASILFLTAANAEGD